MSGTSGGPAHDEGTSTTPVDRSFVRPAAIDVPAGLAGVVVAETTIGDVRGAQGFCHYRQYDAVELAERRSLEDVWFLLSEGDLPTDGESRAFRAEVAAAAALPDAVVDVLPALVASAPASSPLALARTALSLFGAHEGFAPSIDLGPVELRTQCLRTAAVLPALVAAIHRLQAGRTPVVADPDLGVAANYLWMLHGVAPDPDLARGLEQYLVITVDHGFNSSTFAARVITSTGADVAAAVVGAIGALSGPLHGGAPSRALDMLDAIGTSDRAEPWIRAEVERGGRLMGFGHRVYRTDDPRSVFMRSVARRLGGRTVELAEQVEATAIEVLAELKPGRDLSTNVEFYAGVVMERCGVPRELFTPTFACSRAIGWTAHVLEQAADNKLIRPDARYVGAPPPMPVPGAGTDPRI